MSIKKIKENVHFVGAIDWDRKIFDNLIPLPDGTSYNAYIIKGSEKTALIDTVDPAKKDILFENLEKLNVKKIDYIIANHAEQDHSGSIPFVLEKYPEATVVCTPKCKTFLVDFGLVSEDKVKTVEDKENLSLGDKTLEFTYTPWVHWPETMVTYLKEDKILFSCDFFGSHIASSDFFVKEEAKVVSDAKRYYAEIMMPFRNIVSKNIEKIEQYDIDIIAPSHGLMYDKPSIIIDAYKDWVSTKVKNEVVVPYISMHGSTAKMVDHFVNALIDRGIEVKRFDLATVDIGQLAMALVDAATLVLATPTVLAGPHPMAAYAAYLANALRPKLKFASIIGSYSWGGRAVDIIKNTIPNLKVELIEPVLIKGYPKEEDLAKLDEMADTIQKKHAELLN